MRAFLISSLMVVALSAGAFQAPTNEERAKRATEILGKARQLDILNQVLPLLMTPKQLDKILSRLDKHRVESRKLELSEYDYLLKLEGNLDKSLKEAYDKGAIPTREALTASYSTFKMFEVRRQAVIGEVVTDLLKIVDTDFNAGQKKALAGAFSDSLVAQGGDASKLTDDDKRRFFVELILLDPMAYDVLTKLSLKKPAAKP